MWKIREIEIQNQVISAPMAGITNLPFRKILKKMGTGLVVAEMVSDKALCYHNEATFMMLDVDKSEHPMSMQLFGGEVETMVQAAKIIDTHCDCDIIDINMGCPVQKVLKAGAGSQLLRSPILAYEIVSSIVKAVKKPVTVKIRLGWDLEHINVLEIATLLEKAGASAIIVHARTKSQMYEGISDWSYIKAVKQAVSIPVIGNGDIKSPEDAKRMLDETGCDAVMIGRGGLGNPWLYKRTLHYLETNELLPEPTSLERIEGCLAHATSLVDYYQNEEAAMREMRAHAGWYIKGMPHASEYRAALQQVTSLAAMKRLLEELLASIEAKE